jgi:DNA polymerase V
MSDQKTAFTYYDGNLGCGLFGISEDHLESTLSIDDLFNTNLQNIFLIKASGESMSPEICDGDILVVDRSYKIQRETIVACFFNGEALCKKITSENGSKYLSSINPEYQSVSITDSDELIVFGAVVGIVRDRR